MHIQYKHIQCFAKYTLLNLMVTDLLTYLLTLKPQIDAIDAINLKMNYLKTKILLHVSPVAAVTDGGNVSVMSPSNTA